MVKCDKCLHEHKEYYTFKDTTGIIGVENAEKKAKDIIENYEDENFDYDNINERQLDYLNVVFDNDIDKVVALGKELQLDYFELLEITVTGYDAFVVGDKEYLVLTDEEADDLVEERISEDVNNLIYEIKYDWEYGVKKLNFSFNLIEPYIDTEQMVKDWVRDADRGNTLASGDGQELESNYNGTTYYIYRTN
jgi:hypothetical protein